MTDLRGPRVPHAPSWGSKFFQFHAVLGKFWQNRMSAPPPGKLASPPRGNPGSATTNVNISYLSHSKPWYTLPQSEGTYNEIVFLRALKACNAPGVHPSLMLASTLTFVVYPWSVHYKCAIKQNYDRFLNYFHFRDALYCKKPQ